MILGDFFLVLQKKLKTEIPEIKHIDWWNEQLINEEDELPFNLPAVFIEFPPAQVVKLGRRKEGWIQPFILHLVHDVITEARSSKSERVRNNTLRHLEFTDRVHYVLEGYTGIDQDCRCSSIQHTNTTVSHDHDNVIEHLVDFLVWIDNRAAMHSRQRVTPTLRVTANVLIYGGDYNNDFNQDFSSI